MPEWLPGAGSPFIGTPGAHAVRCVTERSRPSDSLTNQQRQPVMGRFLSNTALLSGGDTVAAEVFDEGEVEVRRAPAECAVAFP